MTEKKDNWFNGAHEVISDPLRFKAKLAIGEDAYASLRIKNATFELWDAAGAAGTAVAVAKSTTIASTFFAPTGVLAYLGIGTAATPIGWVVAAGVLVGGGWYGLTRYLKQASGSRVKTIPEFINTPIDVLGLGLFDLLAPLTLKVASIDGEIDAAERRAICSYLTDQWGFDPIFVQEGMAFMESRLDKFSVKDSARSIGRFCKKNKDCNYKEMSRELVNFLHEVVEADGRIDEREEMAIEKVQAIFRDVARFKFREMTKEGAGAASNVAKKCIRTTTSVARKITQIKDSSKKDQVEKD